MTVDMVVNIVLLLLLGATTSRSSTSPISATCSPTSARSGFLLLRRDRPGWPRPIKVGNAWLVIAAVLMVFNLVLVVFGVYDQALASYLGFYEFTGLPLYLGIGVLVVSVLLYFYRRAIQDKAKISSATGTCRRCRTRSRWRCSARSRWLRDPNAAYPTGVAGRPRRASEAAPRCPARAFETRM